MADSGKAFRNFLLTSAHGERRRLISAAFPDLGDAAHGPTLSLYSYLADSPQRFFDRAAYSMFLEWLEAERSANSIRLTACLSDRKAELERAFFLLAEVNRYRWHDDPNSADTYEVLRLLSQQVHPTYLQLIEGVFSSLAYPIAHISRLSRNASTEGLDIFNIVQEVERTPLKPISEGYRHTVRNAIAHGGTTFFDRETVYRDKAGKEETLWPTEMISLLDKHLDICNGMALALKVFGIKHLGETQSQPMPANFLLDEVHAETETPWWTVDVCLPSKSVTGDQLLIYARPETTDELKVLYAAFHTAALSESLMPGYARYFLSLRSSRALPGWAVFNGSKLKEARERGSTATENYAGVLDDNLFFFVPRYRLPRLLYRLDSLLQSFRLHWPLTIRQIRRNLGMPEFRIRSTSIHRNGWRVVVNASAVIDRETEVDQVFIRKTYRKIVRRAAEEARSKCSFASILRYLPLGYVNVAVFNRDHRVRQLTSYGLGPDLVGTVKLKRIRRIKEPDPER